MLLLWDANFGPHEIAHRLTEVGDVLHAAGLEDAARRGATVRLADAPRWPATAVAAGLMLAGIEGQQSQAMDLLGRLSADHPELTPDVRNALGRAAEALLVGWCDVHASDFPARLHSEAVRLGLPTNLIERWYERGLPVKPRLSEAAELLLGGLLDGDVFGVGWLDEPIEFCLADDEREGDEEVAAPAPSAALVTAPAGAAPTPMKAARKRGGVPRGEANVLVREYLREHAGVNPGAMTVRAVAAAVGVSAGSVSQSASWQAFEQERGKRRPSGPRTVPNGEEIILVMADRGTAGPSEAAERNEEAELARQAEIAFWTADQARDMETDAGYPERRRRSRCS